jgi:hypothetical protein
VNDYLILQYAKLIFGLLPAAASQPPSPSKELDVMTRHTKSNIEAIKPDQLDFDAVEKEYGPLPPTASQAALAERYRLAQAAKVIRPIGTGHSQQQNEGAEAKQ